MVVQFKILEFSEVLARFECLVGFVLVFFVFCFNENKTANRYEYGPHCHSKSEVSASE